MAAQGHIEKAVCTDNLHIWFNEIIKITLTLNEHNTVGKVIEELRHDAF